MCSDLLLQMRDYTHSSKKRKKNNQQFYQINRKHISNALVSYKSGVDVK